MLEIKPLTSELTADYLDFFDHRAFSDHNPNGPCYCTSPNMEDADIRQMVSEFGSDVKGIIRRYAVNLLAEGKIHGYLAYDDGISVGWCNAGDMDSYCNTDFIPAYFRQNACGKTMSVVCFAIDPGYRGKGVARALLERVIADARDGGFAAVEGYTRVQKDGGFEDYSGPVRLYEKAGFAEFARIEGRVGMRKELQGVDGIRAEASGEPVTR
ncbi:GNAT family N-acetyltransferase [Paenibacillus mesotrionivorans]|uniref:GNAT family N-acetyltransferase n=1 Tax=Paenibacillus mesotrionivorans TaxID=3160968 RepID=A0ACC7P9K7_9BACL